MANMKILLVEDEAPKRTHIEAFLQNLEQKVIISHAMSVTSALEALETKLPDLLLLDMSLPTYDIGEREAGGRPQGFGGTEVLRHMVMANLECPTIVITGYEAFLRKEGTVDLSQLSSELGHEFPGLLRGVLHYNSTYAEWKVELDKILVELEIISGDID